MNRCFQLTCVAVATMFAVNVQAADIFWMGAAGNLTDFNYSDGTNTNLAPQEVDTLFLGNSGTLTHSVGGLALYQKLRVGHASATPGGVGTATLTVNNGAQISLQSPGGSADASLIVGGGALNATTSGFSGTLNIDGAGSIVTSAQLAQIGYGSQTATTATAIVNVTNGGSLVTTTGDINLGNRNGATGTGLRGQLNLSGDGSSITVATASASMNVGIRGAASSYTQTGGTATIGNAIVVGNNNANGTSFSVTGNSTLTSKSLTIGETANNVTGVLGGTSVINITTNSLNVGLDDSQNASLTVSDTVDINVQNTATGTGNVFIGKDTSIGAKFTMTGGTIDTGRNFLLGNATSATGIVGTQSGGTITTTLNFVVADTAGDSTYNLSGTGAIVAKATVNIGRQTKTVKGVMNQTGGSISSAVSFNIGNAEDTNTTLWGTGIYNISAGTITANQTLTSTAFTIGRQGTGTLQVIGDDGIIDINGNMTVSAAGAGKGTLSYQLETGDLLSMIDVSGTATFSNGAILKLDTSLISPTQTSYDVLTAATFVGIDGPNDPDITFMGPAGWGFQLVPGGNGQILQFYQLPVGGLLGDFNSDGKVDAGDYVTWLKNNGTNNALDHDNGLGVPVGPNHYALWRANFNPPASGTSLSDAQVPEPTTIGLLILGVGSAIMIRGRNRFNAGV